MAIGTYLPTWGPPAQQSVPGGLPYAYQYMQHPAQPIGYPAQQGLKKVNGVQSALQYPVAPNCQSEPLFDFDGKTFYVVSADSAGTKTVETFDFFPHVDTPAPAPAPQPDMNDILSRIERLEEINGIHGQLQAEAPDGPGQPGQADGGR